MFSDCKLIIGFYKARLISVVHKAYLNISISINFDLRYSFLQYNLFGSNFQSLFDIKVSTLFHST